MKRLISGLLLFIISSLTACNYNAYERGGICLFFDDRSIAQWYSLKDVFIKHNIKVTFFVTQFDSLDLSEINMLRSLEKDGHEIASHGAMHVNCETYIKENSYDTYLENEIDSSLAAMNKEGFRPHSFAYPYGAKYWFTDFLLLKKFKIVRGVEPLAVGDIDSNDKILYDFNSNRTVSALSIDKNSGMNGDTLDKLLRMASDNHQVLLLFGHAPASIDDRCEYCFEVEFLEHILSVAKRNNLTFYTMSQLAD